MEAPFSCLFYEGGTICESKKYIPVARDRGIHEIKSYKTFKEAFSL